MLLFSGRDEFETEIFKTISKLSIFFPWRKEYCLKKIVQILTALFANMRKKLEIEYLTYSLFNLHILYIFIYIFFTYFTYNTHFSTSYFKECGFWLFYI